MKDQKETKPMDYNYLQASSSQEFTGLIPAGTVDESEIWEYDEIFPFYPQTAIKKKEPSE